MKRLDHFNKWSTIKIMMFDFDGVFTDNRVMVDEDGKEYAMCTRYDGYGIKKLADIGIESIILTSEPTTIAKNRAKKLGITCYDHIENKLEFGVGLIKSRGLDLEQVGFVGNDINDLELLRVVGLAIITRDAHQDIRENNFYTTKLRGGRGCVREIADLIYREKA